MSVLYREVYLWSFRYYPFYIKSVSLNQPDLASVKMIDYVQQILQGAGVYWQLKAFANLKVAPVQDMHSLDHVVLRRPPLWIGNPQPTSYLPISLDIQPMSFLMSLLCL